MSTDKNKINVDDIRKKNEETYKNASDIYKSAGENINLTLFLLFGMIFSLFFGIDRYFQESLKLIPLIALLCLSCFSFFWHKFSQAFVAKGVLNDIDEQNEPSSKKEYEVDPFQKRIKFFCRFQRTIFYFYSLSILTMLYFFVILGYSIYMKNAKEIETTTNDFSQIYQPKPNDDSTPNNPEE